MQAENRGEPQRAPLLTARARSTADALALGELALEYSLREKQAFYAATALPEEATIYGLYEAYSPDTSGAPETRVYRRITGGPRAEAHPGWTYVAAAAPGYTSLQRISLVARGASACLRSRAHYTATPGAGYIEAITPLPQADAIACLADALGPEPRGRIHVPRTSLAELAAMFRSPSWRLYRYRSGSAEAETRRGEYWAKLSIALHDVYVSDWWLTGVFYAAPPSEIYTILNTLRGMRLDELTLHNIQLAIEKRLETAGLEKRDLAGLLAAIHARVGEKYYTTP